MGVNMIEDFLDYYSFDYKGLTLEEKLNGVNKILLYMVNNKLLTVSEYTQLYNKLIGGYCE